MIKEVSSKLDQFLEEYNFLIELKNLCLFVRKVLSMSIFDEPPVS